MPSQLMARTQKCFWGALLGFSVTFQVASQTHEEAFDGSFLLQTGEIITGGYFVEGAKGHFLYMDTEKLTKGGLFERTGDTVFRSVIPAGAIEITFVASKKGTLDSLVWREQGQKPVVGQRRYPHRSQTINLTASDGSSLGGRLLLPDCPGPHPVIVSVHGSGPGNRYGGPYHTFFLQHGISVLAYDKRGYTTDTKTWQEPNLAVLSNDAIAAVKFAASHAEIDTQRVGIFGSSQAGWVVPRAAVEATETDFIILRAGAGTSESETHLFEVRQELREKGLTGQSLDQAIDLRREIYDVAMNGKPISETDSIVAPYLNQPWYRTAFGEGPISARWSARWWQWVQDNLAVTPAPHLEKFKGPVLWFLAELDENVPLVKTRAALDRAFKKAPHTDHEIVVLEEATHSFLIHKPNAPPRFSPGFFEHMGRWLKDHGFTGAACKKE